MQTVKSKRAEKRPKMKDIRDAETALVECYKELVREVAEAKAAVGTKLLLSRIPQKRLNAYAKFDAECRSILGIN